MELFFFLQMKRRRAGLAAVFGIAFAVSSAAAAVDASAGEELAAAAAALVDPACAIVAAGLNQEQAGLIHEYSGHAGAFQINPVDPPQVSSSFRKEQAFCVVGLSPLDKVGP